VLTSSPTPSPTEKGLFLFKNSPLSRRGAGGEVVLPKNIWFNFLLRQPLFIFNPKKIQYIHIKIKTIQKRNTMKKLLLITCIMCLSIGIWAKPISGERVFLYKVTMADSLAEYVGEYKMSDFFGVYKITIDGGDLYGEADSYGANKLIKQKEADTFVSTSSYGSTIIFTRDATTKKVTGLKLMLQGNEVIGKK
jgi:hypothetical protein